MKGKKGVDIVLLILGLCLLGFWITKGLEAGVSGDEYVHHKHANDVVDYYASFGQKQAALNTPVTNLKYYGQSIDNLSALIVRFFGFKDVFITRHILSIVAGWFIMIFTFLLVRKIGGIWAGILAVLFLLLSPRFIGHSFNNLKDIPFALAYLMSVYYIIKWIQQLPKTSKGKDLMLIFSIALAISVRPAGMIAICYFALFLLVWYFYNYKKIKVSSLVSNFFFIAGTAYIVGLLFWPYALENPIWHPIQSHFVMSNYQVTLRQLFEGKLYWSDQLPWYYIFKFIGISTPIPIVVLFMLSPILFHKGLKKEINRSILIGMFFVIFFPLLFIVIKSSNLYGGARHLLFIYPIICIVTSLLVAAFMKAYKSLFPRIVVVGLLFIGFYHSGKAIFHNHPLQYTYFNQFVGGLKGAQGNYETDYYYTSLRVASEQLLDSIFFDKRDTLIIASNFRIDPYIKSSARNLKYIYTPYYERGNVNWDYGLFVPAHLYPYDEKSIHWPDEFIMFDVEIDQVPLCIGLKRRCKNDYKAFEALKNGKNDMAIDYAQRAIRIKPNNLSANLSLGKAHLELKNYKAARDAFQMCLTILPNYEPASYYLALIEFENQNSTHSIPILKGILEFNPKYTRAHLLLADIHIEDNNYELALVNLKQALKYKPNDEEIINKVHFIKSKYQ